LNPVHSRFPMSSLIIKSGIVSKIYYN
jgi:hypothetical protein